MTNPGKTGRTASYSSSLSCHCMLLFLPCPAHSKTEVQLFAHPPQLFGTVRWHGLQVGGGLEKVLDHMLIRERQGCLWVFVQKSVTMHCCVLFPCLSNLMTRLFWNEPGFSEPPMGHCWLCYLDGSVKEWKYDRCVRIATREDFQLLKLHGCDFVFFF